MNENNICPICGREILDNDDVTVCQQCGTLYHKGCYRIYGCSKCRYPDKNTKKPATCPHCGGRLFGTPSFCPFCGSSLQIKNGEFILADEKERQLRILIGSNQRYYFRVLGELEISGRKTSWNFAGFFFGGYWFVYRKQFGIGLLLIMLRISMMILIYLIPSSPWSVIVSLIDLVINIFSGLFANVLYRRFLYRRLKKAEKMSGKAKETFLRKKGGTGIGMVFLFLFIGYLILFPFMLGEIKEIIKNIEIKPDNPMPPSNF